MRKLQCTSITVCFGLLNYNLLPFDRLMSKKSEFTYVRQRLHSTRGNVSCLVSNCFSNTQFTYFYSKHSNFEINISSFFKIFRYNTTFI